MSAEVNPLDLQPGTVVRGWRIVRRIGKGGYAVVYEVESEGKRYALKLACQTERSLDPRQVDARANREVACLKQLEHPNIIRMKSFGRWPDPDEGFLFIVLEFVDGFTLAQWAEQTGPTAHDYAVLFLKLFDAVDYMHGKAVFHRDLSVNNIMVTKDGEPVIIDFGVADYATADQLTDGPIPPGTPRNRSPQAHRFWEENRLTPGAHYVYTAADDIFALGANLYDLLTDPTPTRSSSRPPLGSEVLEPPSPWKVTKGRVPLDLSGFAMKLISPDLGVRYTVAKGAKRALEEFVRSEEPEWRAGSVHPARTQFPPERPEGAPAPVQAQQAEAPREPIPVHPPPPVQVPPAEPPAGAATQASPRRAWLRPTLTAPSLALAALAVLVLALLLHRPAPPPPSPVARSAPAEQPPASSPLAEKPTSRPAQLASPLPTQKEASPSVKQSDTSPTLTHGTPNAQEQKTTKRRLSKAELCALLVATLEWHAAGCTGVQTRPDPEDCPEESVRAMKELGWSTQGGTQPFILLDVTKGSVNDLEELRAQPLTVWKDGPVTGALINAEGKAPAGTRLDGHLWTTGDRIYGRYLRAHLPGGRVVPICVELKSGGNLGVPKQEGSKPGHTVGDKFADAMAVERWR
jgi:serine/threonine-protein kinase